MHDALDTIVLARRVVSMTGRDAAALAIAGGRIAALGSHAEMLARRDPRTAVVHLDDAVVLPGLIEPHTHPDLCAQCYSWVDVSGFTHATAAGVERRMPIGTAVRAGHRVSLHADSPMYPPGPLGLVRTAVTRRTRTGERLGVHEAISVEQALRAVTIDAAWQLGLEAEVGSLAPGKRADLTILDADPRDVGPEQIDRIAVRATWLDGQPTT